MLYLSSEPTQHDIWIQVLELPPEICDIVEVQYKPAGHISAGLACQLTVVFTPKVSCYHNSITHATNTSSTQLLCYEALCDVYLPLLYLCKCSMLRCPLLSRH